MDPRSGSTPRAQNDRVLYIYGGVACPKRIKQRQMRRAFPPVEPMRRAPGRERSFGSEFAAEQRRRARVNPYSRPSRAYRYRPDSVENHGGEAVRRRSFRAFFADLFETIEERGRRDEAIAKKHAIAWKKFSDHKHAWLTAFVVLAITIGFLFFVYKTMFVIRDVRIDGSDIYSAEQIAASAGFEEGDNLYSFTVSEVEDTVTFHCPYIRSVGVDRTIPKTVALTVTDDSAAYYAVIWGDYVKLSAGLRVLDVTDAETVRAEGLTRLTLPAVQYSVTGRVLTFTDAKHDRYIRNVLAEVAASALAENGMVDAIDVSNAYDITLVTDGRYLLRLGDESDCDLKLRMAYKTLTNEQFDGLLPARIDLTEVGRAIIRPDATLVLE